jgi:hypothetical protein
MIFLIEYDRSAGRIVSMRTYDAARRPEAADARLDLELDLNRKGVDHEVVLLEADSEADLHRTHQRYFKNLRELIEALRAAVSSSSGPPSRAAPSKGS